MTDEPSAGPVALDRPSNVSPRPATSKAGKQRLILLGQVQETLQHLLAFTHAPGRQRLGLIPDLRAGRVLGAEGEGRPDAAFAHRAQQRVDARARDAGADADLLAPAAERLLGPRASPVRVGKTGPRAAMALRRRSGSRRGS